MKRDDPFATLCAPLAYEQGDKVSDICDTFGLSRTEVAAIVRTSGVRRGMDADREGEACSGSAQP